MKKPAHIVNWLSIEEMAVWVREAQTKEEYKKRLAIWLTKIGPFFAHEIANMIQVAKQSVWLWISQYNKNGPKGLERKGRGGRRWAYLPEDVERSLLTSFSIRATKGEIITAKHIYQEVCKVVGKKVSLDYVYRLLYRHGWRKIGPRPRHVKSNLQQQEEFKKNF
jgi:transposase